MLQSGEFFDHLDASADDFGVIGGIASMLPEMRPQRFHMILEGNSDNSLFSLFDKVRFNQSQDGGSFAADLRPTVADTMQRVFSVPTGVTGNASSKLKLDSLNGWRVAHAKGHFKLIPSIRFRPSGSSGDAVSVNPNGSLTIEKSSEIFDVQRSLQVHDGMMANSEKTRCPAVKRGRATPSQAGNESFQACVTTMCHPRKRRYSLICMGTCRGWLKSPTWYASIIAYQQYDQRYTGYGTLNVNPVDVISGAEYQWKQAAVHVAISGYELRVNSGVNQIVNLAKAKILNAQRSAANGMSIDLYSDGTASYQINGLQAVIADTPTNTVGGISSTTFAFWKNIVQSAAAPLQGGAAITTASGTIGSLMRPAFYAVTRGTDKPDLIVSSQDYYEFLESSQETLKQYVSLPGEDNTTADGSFVSLKWKGADVIFEGDGIIPLQHMYMINTDYLELVVHEAANWTEGEKKYSFNQDAAVIPLIWQGNLVCTCRKLQAVVKE